jgi:hypothetical protein
MREALVRDTFEPYPFIESKYPHRFIAATDNLVRFTKDMPQLETTGYFFTLPPNHQISDDVFGVIFGCRMNLADERHQRLPVLDRALRYQKFVYYTSRYDKH